MTRRAITEATCTDCDDDSNEFSVEDSELSEHDDAPDEIRYNVRCSCGNRAVITVDEEGTHAGSGATHENASWNTENDDE